MSNSRVEKLALVHSEPKAPAADLQGGLRAGIVRVLMTEREASVALDGGGDVLALQAAGCLLSPAIGDRVLVLAGNDQAYILSVLERVGGNTAELGVPGADKINLKAVGQLDISAPEIRLGAGRLHLLADAITQTGRRLSTHATKIFEHVIDKVVSARSIATTAQTRTAVVREVETLNAGTLIQNIDTVATQNSEIALVTAKNDVRLDAKRVSVG